MDVAPHPVAPTAPIANDAGNMIHASGAQNHTSGIQSPASTGASIGVARKEPGPCAYVLYYSLLFFAYWFGSYQFDQDSDGGFDEHDARIIISKCRRSLRQFLGMAPRNAPPHHSRPDLSQASGSSLGAVAEDAGLGALTSAVSGVAEEDQIVHNLRSGKRRPIFVVLQVAVCFLLWLVCVIRDEASGKTEGSASALSARGGLDSLFDGATVMRTYEDCKDQRDQLWRMLTYQFTHVGLSHVFVNGLLLALMGLPLEALHGTPRMALMFNIGVFGGACSCLVSAAHSPVVGMSGGCYALMGMHLADLVLNWSQKRFRLPTLAFLLALAWIDLMLAWGTYSDTGNASHSAHFGGYVAGTCIGVVMGSNLKVQRWERVLQAFVFAVGACLVIGCLLWSGLQWPPRDIWHSFGYCWVRQVYNGTLSPDWSCIRCEDQQCISNWMQQKYIQTVNVDDCISHHRWIDNGY